MGMNQKAEDSIDSQELDTEGHRVLRVTPDEDVEDTEGHRVLR